MRKLRAFHEKTTIQQTKTRGYSQGAPSLRVEPRGRLTASGKKQIALNVIERGRAWHWTKLPKGWFDLDFCLAHGQMRTKQALRELFPPHS